MFIFCAIAHKLGVPSGLQRLWTWIWSPDLWWHGFGSESFALLPLVSWNAEQAMGRAGYPSTGAFQPAPMMDQYANFPYQYVPPLQPAQAMPEMVQQHPGHVLGAIALFATATTVCMWTWHVRGYGLRARDGYTVPLGIPGVQLRRSSSTRCLD